ncbi:MAG: phosphoadenylyl-sulfate reductase [Candidatus Odinarchaeota archaeon]
MVVNIFNLNIEKIQSNLDDINKIFKGKNAEEILKWAYEIFGEGVILASSLGLEDQVLTDMASKIFPRFHVFVVDTGRLHQETYDVLEETKEKYKISYKIFFPRFEDVETLVREHGVNAFYKSLELRHRCCGIRKVEPLKRALKGYKAWITGLRKAQSVTRTEMQIIEWDEMNNLIKINPLIEWTDKQVKEYIYRFDVPYNKLFDKGYTSIGCAPCTRPTKVGEHPRSGRWWWEAPEKRECGLHEKH